MAASLLDVMEAVEAALATIEGLRTSESKPGQITPPMAVVGVPTVPDYHLTSNRMQMTVQLMVLVSDAVTIRSQKDMAAFASRSGARSIVAALEFDKSLGGVVEQCWVSGGFRPLSLEEVGLVGYFGGVWELTIVAIGV